MEENIVDFKQSKCIRKDFISKNKSETNINKSNLINFISNSNKFHFNSAFDHKGAKSFLKSKEKALKKIIIDENLDGDEKNIKSKNKNEKFLNVPKMVSNQEIFRLNNTNKDIDQHLYLSSFGDKRIKSQKNIHDKKVKFISSYENEDNKEDNKEKKHLNIKPKSIKFYSQSELKMLKDEEIKKLKPIKIKTFKNDRKFNSVKKIEKTNIKRIDIRPSDSSLITLIHEMSNKNI